MATKKPDAPTHCAACLGNGGTWHTRPDGSRWPVRDLRPDDAGRYVCSFCRRFGTP